MRKPRTQFLGSRGSLHLLLHTATLIGQLDNKLCHKLGYRQALAPSPAFLDRFPVQGYISLAASIDANCP